MSVTRLSAAEASAHVLADVAPLGDETVELREALGRVLARDVVSPVSLPPWDNASMDGFAVRASDVRGASASEPVRLRVVETIAAGTFATRALEPGVAMRIMTGAPVPTGADSVIRVEDTSNTGEVVEIRDDRDAASNVRVAGEDVRAGVTVMRAGTTLGAPHIGVLSSVGCARPHVHRRPRVAILGTGDELVPLEQFADVLAGRRIVSSNSYSLEAAVRAAGGDPVAIGTVQAKVGIKPGKAKRLKLKFVPPATLPPGTYTLRLAFDPNGQFADPNAGDNVVDAGVTIQSGP